ncbi:MAG TPA: SPOR domain-containing protein [Spirochaetales bacterium]|nr:SPOR domain-containing protein [Spirochaetales bacterium]
MMNSSRPPWGEIKRFFLFWLILFLTPLILQGEPSLEEAQSLEEQGKAAAALTAYRQWLKANTSSPQYGEVVLHASALEPDPNRLLEFLKSSLDQIKKQGESSNPLPAEAGKIALRLSLLQELLGNIEAAWRGYESSTVALPQYKLNLAALLVEQGKLEKALEVLDGIAPAIALSGGKEGVSANRDIIIRSRILKARILTLQNKIAPAERTLRELLALRIKSDYLAEALLALFELLINEKRRSDGAEVLEELRLKFPRSPEYILAQAIWENRVDAVVVFAFSPLRLLHSTLGSGSLTDTAEEKKAPLPGPVSSEEQLVLVQVGSFRMKENAEYLASDLQGLGFAAYIVDFKLEDNLYYRVVVDPPRVVEEAQKVLMHLKDAGFEGFLLFPD